MTKLLNEFKQAQAAKDYKRENEIRLALDNEAATMDIIQVPGIPGTRLYNWQGGIGSPPSAVKVNGKWYMLEADPRRFQIDLIPPTQNKRGLLSIIGRLYRRKHTLPVITIDDLKELLGLR